MKVKEGFIQLVAVVIVGYTLIFGLVYFFDPLAQSPQLDAQENLILASDINGGLLEEAPIYRAMGYPYVLSLLKPEHWRPELGLILGILCHLLSAWLVSRLAMRIWPTRGAGLLAAGLFLVNPASLFYSLQLLDVSLATSLFLGGLYLGLSGRGLLPFLGSGILFGLAIATRPHFLPAVLLAPVVLLFINRDLQLRKALIWIPVMGMLLMQGFINLHHSGEFRILPWQGAYNLWAANKPGANGLHFRQSVDLSQRGAASNPARVESIYLYGQAHPNEQPPYSIDKMNAYWRGQFLGHLKENPLEVARLWAFKAYAVINSFEQYNNLTFSFHKERLPLLRFNPLSWGILLILGTVGLLHLWRQNPRTALAWLSLILAYASMLIVFYASARFRLPLVPLLAILAGGCIGWFDGITRDRLRILQTAAIIICIGGITFSSFAGIRNKDTYIQDQLLMANANAELGHDREAARWAREVLRESPNRNEAVRIYMISYFNLALLGQGPEPEFGSWESQKPLVQDQQAQDSIQQAIFGVYLWKWGSMGQAVSLWSQLAESGSAGATLSQAALVAAGETGSQTEKSPLAAALSNMLTSK
jgi:hypothetical protein